MTKSISSEAQQFVDLKTDIVKYTVNFQLSQNREEHKKRNKDMRIKEEL